MVLRDVIRAVLCIIVLWASAGVTGMQTSKEVIAIFTMSYIILCAIREKGDIGRQSSEN